MELKCIKKIAIVGAESTGKSALAEALAAHHQCLWVPEFARQYLSEINRPYNAADVETIARGQIALEDQLEAQSQGLLFCDTNLWVIKVWMDNAFGNTPDWIWQELNSRRYHLHVVTDFEIPYEPDPLREHPEQRPHFTALYRKLLEAHKVPYVYAKGTLAARVALVSSLLSA